MIISLKEIKTIAAFDVTSSQVLVTLVKSSDVVKSTTQTEHTWGKHL